MSLSSPRLSISQDSSSTTGTAPEIQSPSTLSSSSATNITGPDTINATETSAIPNIRTPYASSPGSAGGSSTGLSYQHGLRYPDHYFRSRRVQKGDIAKPWLEKKDLREKWVTIIPCVGLLFGLAICGLLVYLGLKSVVNHKYCPVMMEDWSNGFDESIWTREVEVGGYGNGQFDYTTNSEENSYVKDGALHIRPTLNDENLIMTNGAVLNLTAMGICTSNILSNCVSYTDLGNGTFMNPVKSARISSKKGASIKYGRIEVQAKMPAGKWLWPAIWMLPVEETYGPWPASGEIDIVESRGNDRKYLQGGNDIVTTTLHWGPDPANNAWWRTNAKRKALHTTYSDKFHTFGIEWSEDYIFTYINSRLLQVMYTNFKQRLWERGNFPLANANGTRFIDPWAKTGRQNTPFDHSFYLIMNVAVGATNGFFENSKQGKPWVDGSKTERKDFWERREEWYPTWKDNSEMVVKSVKMWQQCD